MNHSVTMALYGCSSVCPDGSTLVSRWALSIVRLELPAGQNMNILHVYSNKGIFKDTKDFSSGCRFLLN